MFWSESSLCVDGLVCEDMKAFSLSLWISKPILCTRHPEWAPHLICGSVYYIIGQGFWDHPPPPPTHTQMARLLKVINNLSIWWNAFVNLMLINLFSGYILCVCVWGDCRDITLSFICPEHRHKPCPSVTEIFHKWTTVGTACLWVVSWMYIKPGLAMSKNTEWQK